MANGPLIPKWVSNVGSAGKELLADPQGYIKQVVLVLVVGGVLSGLEAVVDLVLSALAIVRDVPLLLADSITAMFQPIGPALLGPFDALANLLAGLATAAGPLAPLAVAVVAVAVLRLAERVGWLSLELLSPRLAAVVRGVLNIALPWRWL